MEGHAARPYSVQRVFRVVIAILALAVVAGCSVGTPEGSQSSSDRGGSPAAEASAPPNAASMPPFTEDLEALRDFYRMEFLRDGYPGRLGEDGTLEAHPIYGVYVLNDYLEQYERNPTVPIRRALEKVASAAVSRMDPFRDSIVFWYEPAPEMATRLHSRHYSGLTQGYYASTLHRVGVTLGERRFINAARKVFDSLLIPVERGGVYHNDAYGVSIAEVPSEPNGLILNGWQSALASVGEYADLTGSPRARRLYRQSAESMAKILPLYDHPQLKNSRYALLGSQYVRLVLADREQVRDISLRHRIPREGTYPVPVREASRWQYFAFPEDLEATPDGHRPTHNAVRANLLVSRGSFPTPNALLVTIDAIGATTLDLELQVGSYDPLLSSPANPKWVNVGTHKVPAGRQTLEIELPWSATDLTAGYPTNFAKVIDGENTNVYHRIHIKRLRELYETTQIETFRRFADRWEGYICDWASMDLYDGLHVRGTTGEQVVPPDQVCAATR